MAASTADRFDLKLNRGPWYAIPVAASTNIYQGTMVAVTASGTNGTGLLTPLADTAGLRFVGMARQQVLNTGTTGGEVSCQVEPISILGRLLLNAATPLQSWVGRLLFAIDDHTVGLAASTSNTIAVGRCVAVWSTGSTGSVIVDTHDQSNPSTTG